jgi:Lecithin retinol acyltransferase
MGEVDFAAFKPADHLRVRRRLYYYHGIYVGDGRVVQFGGGAGNKRHNRIEEVQFATFASGGRVELVDQARLTWIGLWRLPPPFPPDQIVARARCLVAHDADAAYNLIGRNCETVALWCACGMGESLQRQRFQAVNAGWPFSPPSTRCVCPVVRAVSRGVS